MKCYIISMKKINLYFSDKIMKKQRYGLMDSLRILSGKGVSIEGFYLMVKQPAENCSLGNGSWGRIDYLVKAHHYRVVWL